MAKQNKWESDCKINLPDGTSCNGVATVMEVGFDDDFTAWLARVRLTNGPDFARLSSVQGANDGVGIFFGNGRDGHAKLVRKVVGDGGAFFYFVGITELKTT